MLDHGQRLQIEHRDGLVAAVGREAVTGLGGDAGAVHAGSVRNVADHRARGAVHDHHVRGTRYEHAACRLFHGDVVGATFTLDVESLHLECLRVADGRCGKTGGGNHGEQKPATVVWCFRAFVADRIHGLPQYIF